MTSLTRAKKMTTVISIGVGVGIVVLIVGRVFLSIVGALTADKKAQEFNTLPNVTFGQIDEPTLPLAEVTTTTATLSLDLVRGNYPEASNTATVYRAADTSPSLSAQDRARAKATNLGFTSSPSHPTPSTFSWQEGIRSLTVDLGNQTFKMSSEINRLAFNNRESFSRFSPIGQQVSQFVRAQFQFTDLQYDSPEVQFVNPVGGEFVPQNDTAVAPTNYARATFLRQKINDLPIYSPAGKFGPVSAVIIPPTIKDERDRSTRLDMDQVVELQNYYFPIQLDKSAIYPIITSQTAYKKLEADIGRYLVSVTPINSDVAPSSFMSGRVLFITLCYIEPDSKNPDYVQPVWMFEGRANTDVGDARWVSYVPAIDQAYVRALLGAN